MINLGDINTVSMASSLDYASQNFVEKAFNTTAAAVVDVGTTIWNSIVPEATGMEVSTRKLLQDMGATGALSAYNNNKDVVQAMSFIGGMLIPGGAALKLARGVRAGLKGTSFLSPARQVEDLAKYESLIADGLKGTAEYKKVRNAMFLRSQANNLLDTAATELAIIGTFNAHPYMEDYMEDPIKNFGISMAIGGGIGAGITGLISHAELKAVGARINTEALEQVRQNAKVFDVAYADTAATLSHLNLAASRLETMAKLPDYNGLTKQIATDMAQNMRVRMGELAASKMSPEMSTLSTEVKNAIASRFTDLRFLGTDKVKFYKPLNIGELNVAEGPKLGSMPIFKKRDLVKDEDQFVRNSFYSPEFDAFVDNKLNANLITTAADVNGPKAVDATLKRFSYKAVTNSFAKNFDINRTGDVEMEYLAGLKYYSSLSTDKLAATELFATDYAAINGWLSAVNKRKASLQEIIQNPEADSKALAKATEEYITLTNTKIKLYEDEKYRLVNMEEVTDLPTAAIDPVNYVKPTHFADINNDIKTGVIKPLIKDEYDFNNFQNESNRFYDFVRKEEAAKGNIIRDDWHSVAPRKMEQYAKQYARENHYSLSKYANEEAQLNSEAILFLARWIGGHAQDKEHFRNAMASARTLRRGMSNNTPEADAITNILNSPLVRQQKKALGAHSDAKGNIYIKRGTKTQPNGDTSVSSYTFNDRVASLFGTPHTYKVNLDDVIGYLYRGESEWLIGASTRDTVDKLPAGAAKFVDKQKLPVSKVKFAELDHQELAMEHLRIKGEAINEAIKGGMKAEVAAIKFNTTPEMVQLAASNRSAFIDMANGDVPYAELNARVNRWNTEEQVGEALSPARRIMHITANKQQIVGETGDILDKHRAELRGEAILDRRIKRALNEGDTTYAMHLSAKLNAIDEQYATINKLWVETSVLSSKSAIAAAALKEVLNAGEYKALREGLAQFNNSKGGNPLFQSADMVTSNMGEIGRLSTALGDKVIHIANQVGETFTNPIASAFRTLYTNDAARTEFAIFDNLRLSNRGLIRYDPEQRTFVTGTLDTTTGALKNPKPITDMVVKHDEVHRALQAIESAAFESHETQTVVNRLSGKPRPASIGFWLPYTNLKNKEYAFVLNTSDNTQKLLVADTYEGLQDLAKAYNAGPDEVIRFRTEVSNERLAMMQDDLEIVTTANVGMQKRGIGLAAPDLSPQRLSDIIEGFRDRFNAQTRALVEYGSFDLMKKLDYLSAQAQKPLTDTNKTGFLRTVKQAQTKDTAADIKDILLGRNPAYRSELMQALNKPVDTGIQFAIEAVGKAFQVARQGANLVKDGDTMDWDKYEAARKAMNIPDPYAAFNDAAKPLLLQRARNAGITDPNRVVRAGNEMASMLALKFGEIAQPLVNMLSLPILSTSTINRAIKAANIENANQMLNSSSLSIMYNGIRRMNSKDAVNVRLFQMADEEGLLEPILSEVDEVMKMSRFSTGAIANLEKALDSNFVKIMSKPSELAEGLVRKAAFGTGVELAKRIYGNAASDRQVLIYARDYMKQALGNYSTAQRPMMFQGSLGAAMGLFQTYMLTYAQNMYRHLDLKDYKGLGQTMLAQAGIFGVGSLPGFQPISQAIGNHFSDENYDLYTGTYRAIGDDAASVLLYGLPSNLGPAVHTRGDVNPRIPTGFETMVAPSMVGQVIGSMVEVGKSVLRQDGNAGQAFFEALSTQSVSRPVARLSELASGYSVTGPGNTIAGPEEVWSWQGILSRVMSTRPLNEAKVRESIHLNSYYGSLDREAKQAVLERMRTAIRANNLNDELMDELATSYLRTGTPQGFRQAVNQAFLENSNERLVDLHNRFGDSPLMLLVDDLD